MVIQVLNSKLGITPHGQENHTQKYFLYMFTQNIFVYGSLGREDGCRCDRNT